MALTGLVGRSSRPAIWRGETTSALVVVFSALGIGYLIANDHLRTAYAGVCLAMLLWLIPHRRAAIAALAASIPFPASLAGHAAVAVALSDLLLMALLGLVIVESVGTGDWSWTRLGPLWVVQAPYLAWMVVLLGAHLGVVPFLQSLQRLELFLVPVLIGFVIGRQGHAEWFLGWYVAASTVFAGLYPFFSTENGGLGAQKNPAGQFIANALLIALVYRSKRHWMIYLVPVLTLGLFWTQSRGALLSVAVGVVVLLVFSPGASRARMITWLLPVGLVAYGAFMLLPESAQQRNLDFSSDSGTRAAYSMKIRYEMYDVAWAMIHRAPIFGTGVGQYKEGIDGIIPPVADPHQVLLFQAAEGGYPLLASFLVLMFGAAAFLISMTRGGNHRPAVALAIMVGTAVHGLLDVYWVRGTPTLGWLMVGMVAANMVSQTQAATSASLPEEENQCVT